MVCVWCIFSLEVMLLLNWVLVSFIVLLNVCLVLCVIFSWFWLDVIVSYVVVILVMSDICVVLWFFLDVKYVFCCVCVRLWMWLNRLIFYVEMLMVVE